MEFNRQKLQRAVIRAIFRSLRKTDEDIRWRRFRFDKSKLSRQLAALGNIPDNLINNMVKRLGISVLRQDPLCLNIHGFERKFDRQAIAEGAGAVGVQFFPTHESAMRSAYESARETAYFGYGSIDKQTFACPIAALTNAIHTVDVPESGTILRDMRDHFEADLSIYDVLNRDIYFSADVHDANSLQSFQTALRQNPMSSEFIEKSSEFFMRKVTIGVRDTFRWILGSRHPWFDWNRAKELVNDAFNAHRHDNFNTPQIVYYTYDPNIDEVDIEATAEHNNAVIRAFATTFQRDLQNRTPDIAKALKDKFYELSRWILDIHHDYPDFDLEAEGCCGSGKHIDFLGHSIQNKVNQELLGEKPKLRRNINMRAHFDALRLTQKYLDNFNDEQRETFFSVLAEKLEKYDAQDGEFTENGTILYQRIPCTLFLIQDLGIPTPHSDERLLDAFDLSEMTQLEHASYMRTFPEISEKLVVFFALTLRHLIDTEHVPDLRPRNFAKDFLLLGLWGTRTPNIHINLYVDSALDEKDLAEKLSRCEIKFTGTEQVETHPLQHIREEAKVWRMAVAHFAPLIEPSILRNLGTFTMAMEEFRSSGHEFKIDSFSLMHYAVDMIHEMARFGIRRSLTDIMAVIEYIIDNTHDNVEQNLNKTAKLIKKNKDSKF